MWVLDFENQKFAARMTPSRGPPKKRLSGFQGRVSTLCTSWKFLTSVGQRTPDFQSVA